VAQEVPPTILNFLRTVIPGQQIKCTCFTRLGDDIRDFPSYGFAQLQRLLAVRRFSVSCTTNKVPPSVNTQKRPCKIT
jgi:hypothetical protein